MFFGNQSKIRLFREKASDQPDGILDGGLLPAMEGITEVELSPQHLVSILVLHVFATIIVGDGARQGLGVGAELANQGASETSGGLGRELELGEGSDRRKFRFQ